MHVMPHARVVSRILQASGTACINALGRLGSALLTPLSLHTSRLLPLQYRLVLCSLFLNTPVDNCFHFSIPFYAISATSQKCFGGHGRSPLHSISDQVPFTCARSKQHNATYSNCRGSKCFCCCEAVFSCGLCRMPWPCVCPIQVHSNRVTNNYI